MREFTVAIDARLISTRNTGDTSYWRGLIWGLAQLPNCPKIRLYSDNPTPPRVPGIEKFEWISLNSPHSRIWSLITFPQAAKKHGADVIHTQYNLSPFVGNIGVTTIHDVSFFVNPEWYSPKDRWILKSQIPRSARQAKRILTVSETSKKEIEKYIPAAVGKTVVTPNALDPEYQPPAREDAKKIVAARVKIDRPYIFLITSRWPRKNPELAYQAWKAAFPNQEVALVTCGPGDPLGPETTHLGYVDHDLIAPLYAAAECYLLPSLHEGFGIPILEAFAAKCPVIAGPGGAIPEVAHKAAIITENFEVSTWTQAIQNLLADSGTVKEMVSRGTERLQAFSWERTAQLTIEAYGEVANG